MEIHLNLLETRLIACLLEKEIATPEQYPLSLNALMNACNQKSNREPVMALDESEVQQVLDELIKEHLVIVKTGFGSRTPKYQHRFCNTAIGTLAFSAHELGIITVMLLRGPQTPGELRNRTNRLCEFTDVNQVDAVLQQLIDHKEGPFVKKLTRQAGKRESRYAHLFSDSNSTQSLEDRVTELEQVVIELRKKIESLSAAKA